MTTSVRFSPRWAVGHSLVYLLFKEPSLPTLSHLSNKSARWLVVEHMIHEICGKKNIGHSVLETL